MPRERQRPQTAPVDPSLESDALLRDWKRQLDSNRKHTLKQLSVQEREVSYRVRTGSNCVKGIPAYDPEKDANCPLARARVFNRHQQRIHTAPSGASRRAQAESATLPVTNEDVVIPFKGRKGLPSKVYNGERRVVMQQQRSAAASAASAAAAAQVKQDTDQPSELELMMFKKAILRDALIEELRLLINDTEGEGVMPSHGKRQHTKPSVSMVLTGVASNTRAQQCVKLLQKIRSSALEVMEAVKTWRRSKLCMKLPFVLRGRNYLIKMITDLDFVHRHDLVVRALGHPMRCNPFVLHHTSLCPDPFRGHHTKQQPPMPATRNNKAQTPVPEVNETVGESDLARIQEHERTILAELRFTGTVLRPPSPRQLMAWAQGPQSSLPDDADVKLRSRELLGMDKRLNTVQSSIEEDDMEVLRLEGLLRPLRRQLPQLDDRAQEIQSKLKEAEALHQDHRALRLRLELRYWRTEHDNLELQIKAKMAKLFLRKMEMGRKKLQVDKMRADMQKRREELQQREVLRRLFNDSKRQRAAQILQALLRGFLGRRRVAHKRQFIAEHQEATAAAGTITRALRQATAHRRYKKRKAALSSEADRAAQLQREEEERLAALARIKTFADASAQTDPVIIVPLVTPKSAAQVPPDYQAALLELTQRGSARASTRQTQRGNFNPNSKPGVNSNSSTGRLREPVAELGNRGESVQLPAVATYRPSHTSTLNNNNSRSSARSIASNHSGSSGSGSQDSNSNSNPVAAFVALEPSTTSESQGSGSHGRRRSSGVLEVLTEMRRASGPIATEGEDTSLCSQVTHTGATNSPTSISSGQHAQIPEDEEEAEEEEQAPLEKGKQEAGGGTEDVGEVALEVEGANALDGEDWQEDVLQTPPTSAAPPAEHVPSEEREEQRQEGSDAVEEEGDSTPTGAGP